MELDLSSVEFSNNDKRKSIRLPSLLSPELSEALGVVIGDGHVICSKPKYRTTICGCRRDMEKYFGCFIIPLFKNLFNISPYIHFQRENEVNLDFSSKALASLFSKVFKIQQNKKDVQIPDFILESPRDIQIGLIRGLFDTDGFIGFRKKHKTKQYYPLIGFGTVSQTLIKQVERILHNLGFNFTSYKSSHIDKRNGKTHSLLKVDLNGKDNLTKWMSEIGFHNRNNLEKYTTWLKMSNGPGEN